MTGAPTIAVMMPTGTSLRLDRGGGRWCRRRGRRPPQAAPNRDEHAMAMDAEQANGLRRQEPDEADRAGDGGRTGRQGDPEHDGQRPRQLDALAEGASRVVIGPEDVQRPGHEHRRPEPDDHDRGRGEDAPQPSWRSVPWPQK